jgi:hypothetical protein
MYRQRPISLTGTNVPSSDSPSVSTSAGELRLEEFRQLRATIRERGTARALVSVITFVSWAALAVASIGVSIAPLSALAPLVVLAGGFEVMFALHVGAERIGRYVFVFYEHGGADPTRPKWESAIASFGRTPAAALPRVTALAEVVFIMAALTNLIFAFEAFGAFTNLPATRSQLAGPLATLATVVAHLLFIGRVLQARQQAKRQRERDTATFTAIAKQL